MEEEAREILRSALNRFVPPAKGNLAEAIRRRFAAFGGLEFEVAPTRCYAPSTRICRMIILDTNVLSELMRPKPSARVVAWVAKQPAAELFTTSITEAEIFYGIELLGKGKRREGLLAAAEAMFTEDLAEATSSVSRAIQRELFPGSPFSAVRSAGPSVTRMRRSRPLPKCGGRSSRRAMLQISWIAA